MVPKISIALTTYNGESYLQQQLESIADQTFLPTELVIFDDCSTDKTCEIIDRFINQTNLRVKFFKNVENVGYNQNFSRALSKCVGDIVFICDQDDLWELNKIERVVQEFTSSPEALVVIHDLEFCDSQLRSLGEYKINRVKQMGNPLDCYVTGMATAVRGDFLKLILPIPVSNVVAFDDWIHACARLVDGKKICFEVLAKYRRHDQAATSGSAINKARKSKLFDHLYSSLAGSSFKSVVYEVGKQDVLLQWLSSNYDNLLENGFSKSTDLDAAKITLFDSYTIYCGRYEILKTTGISRIILSIKFYFLGKYKYFQGLKSLIKDITIR